MSTTTVDSRVVEMRFDNSHFERNVKTSMSTLEKFKKSLNFNGATKGVEDVEKAVNNVNFSQMTSNIDKIGVKFSYMQATIQHQINRMVDSAVNAGKRLVSSLSVDQITAGWAKFSDKTTSVATLVAQGNAIEDVNSQLDRLNWFTDETSYNFTEMVSNIAKFTATGKGLEESVTAMEGIATWAALSGQNANTASHAMYQLSQAMGAGVMRLEDYKSIQNASMDTEEFRQKCLDAGVALGTLKKNVDGTYASLIEGASGESFNISQFSRYLTQEMWLTSDVMMKVFNDYSAAVEGIYTAADEKGKLASEIIDEIYTTAKDKSISTDDAIKSLGYNFDSFALKAFEAAQKARTFNDAIDSVKDAVSTGWMKTFELIFGDAEAATELWTDLANTLYDVFAAGGEVRNELLESTMGKNFAELGDVFKGVSKSVNETVKTVTKVTKTIDDLGDVVDDVILGKFGNGQERFDKLSAAGHNWCKVQNEVNKKLGNGKRYTEEQIKAQDKLLGKQEESVAKTKKVTKGTSKLTDTDKEYIKQLVAMNDAELKNLNLTDEQIKALKQLKQISNKIGVPIEDLIDNLDELNGRWLLINSFKNIGNGLLKVFSSISTAFRNVFKAIDSDQLFDIIAGFHKLTTGLIMSDDTTQDLIDTLTGLFSILHLIATLAKGGFSIGFTVVTKVLDKMGTSVLGVTSKIGNAITKLHDFIYDNSLVNKGIELLADGITTILDIIDELINKLINNPIFETVTGFFTGLFGSGTEEKRAQALSGSIDSITNAISNLASGDKVNVFNRISQGMKSMLDITNSKWAASLSSGLKILNSILGLFGTNLTLVIDDIADYITKVAGWIETNTPLINTNEKIAKALEGVVKKIVAIVKAFAQLEPVKKVVGSLANGFSNITDVFNKFGNTCSKSINNFIKSLSDLNKKLSNGQISTKEMGMAIVQGIANGIVSAAGDAINAILEIGKIIIDSFCGLLRMHSPSRVAMGWGINIIEGIILGLKAMLHALDDGVGSVVDRITGGLKKGRDGIMSGAEELLSAFQTIWENFLNLVDMIDFKAILSIIPITVIATLSKKIYDLMSVLVDGIKGVNNVLAGLANIEGQFARILNSIATVIQNDLANVLRTMSLSIKATAIQKLVKSLAILVGAVIALSIVKTAKLYAAVGAIVILVGVLAALVFAVNMLESSAITIKDKSLDISGLKTTILQIGIVLALLAASVKILGSMTYDQLVQGFIGIAGVIAALAVVMLAIGIVGKYSKGAFKYVDNLGGMMIKLSIALLLMVGVCKLAGNLSETDLDNGISVIRIFTVFTALMIGLGVLARVQFIDMTKMVSKLSVSLALMVVACKLAGMLNGDDLFNGVAVMFIFGTLVATLAFVSRMDTQKHIDKVSGMILSLSVALSFMVIACKLAGMLSLKGIVLGVLVATAFTKLIGCLVKSTTIGEKQQIAKASGILLAASVAIAIMAGVCILLGLLSLPMILKGGIAVSAFGVVLALIMSCTKVVDENAEKTFMKISVAIGVIAASVLALSLIKSEKLAGATAALSVLMGMFAFIVISSRNVSKASLVLAVMTIAIGALAFMTYKLSKLETKKTLAAAASIGILMIAISASLRLISGVHGMLLKSISAVIALSAMIAPMLLFIYALKQMNGVENAMDNVKALSILMGVMTALLGVLTVIGCFIPLAIYGVVALSAMWIPMRLFINILKKMNGVENASDNAEVITGMMTTLTELLYKLSLMGPLALIGVAAMAGLVSLMGAIGMMATAAGALASIPGVEDFLNKGLPLLEKLAGSIGRMVGSFVSNIATTITGSLYQIGMDIADFMDALSVASDKASGIKGESFNGAKKLIDVMNDIAGMTIGSTVSDIFTLGGTSMDKFKKDSIAFFDTMVEISAVTEDVEIDDETFNTLVLASEKLANLQSSIKPLGGLVEFFTGKDDLATFATNVGEFFNAMSAAISELKITSYDEDSFSTIIKVSKKLATLQQSIEPMGGVITWFSGRDDLGTFGDNVGDFFVSMKNAISELNDVQINNDALDSIIKAMGKLVELQGTIDSIGGLKGAVIGRDDLGAFGLNVSRFAGTIAEFSNTASAIKTDAIDAVVNTTNRIKNLISSLAGLDASGVVAFTGIGTGGFGADGAAYKIAKAMATYSEEVSNVDEGKVSVSVNAATQLKSLIENLTDFDPSGISNFKPDKIGKIMADYSKTVKGIEPSVVESSVSSAVKLRNFISSLTNLDISGIATFKNAVNELSTINFSSGLDNSTANMTLNNTLESMNKIVSNKSGTFNKQGATLMTQLSKGISSKSSNVTKALSTCLNSAVQKIQSFRYNFYSAGSYLVSGFANGISINTYKAVAKSRLMAKNAKEAAEKELDINSPSRVFFIIGKYVSEGFANGISKFAHLSSEASTSMADGAIDEMKHAITNVASIASGEMDLQPTIAPVLDLSNIRAGAGEINGLLGNGVSLGALSNIGVINRSMNQNGNNSDVISAIESLGKELGRVNSGPSYVINGISYDDGSNISNAVKDIVRAVKIERRV